MSVNLIDLVKSQLGNQAIGQIAGLLGESSDKTQNAISGALPALMGGLLQQASSSSGAGNLLNSLSGLDDGLLNNIGGMLGGNQSKGVMDMGSKLLGTVLGGGNLNSLVGAISGFSGLGKGAAGSLLGLLAPILMGTVKRQLMGSGGLNVGNLTSLLMGQKSNIAAAMPQGLNSHLSSSGLGDLLGGILGSAGAAGQQAVNSTARAVGNAASTASGAARSVANTANNTATTAARGGSNLLRWLLPLIIIAALAFFFLNRGGRNAVQSAANSAQNAAAAATEAASTAAAAAGEAVSNATEAVTETAANAVNAAGDAVANATEAVNDAVNAASTAAANAVKSATSALTTAGDTLKVGDINVGTEISGIFGSFTEALSGITNEATAKNALPKLNELSGQLDGITDLFKQLPEAGKGVISKAVGESTSGLNGLIAKISELPGVGSIIKPVIDLILQKLAALTA